MLKKKRVIAAALIGATVCVAACGDKSSKPNPDNMEGGSAAQPSKATAPPGGESPGKPPTK